MFFSSLMLKLYCVFSFLQIEGKEPSQNTDSNIFLFHLPLMFSLSTPSSSSLSSSSSSHKKYEVFLSFRGRDTRKNFTDHLYAAFIRNGIKTFRDDRGLKFGEEIAPELFKAIQESWCSLIVFSETYAFSHWCLDELAEIVEQRNNRGQKIFPVFYDVIPSDLRYQKGKIEKAFAEHEERYKENKDKIKRWRSALNEVADIKGWNLSDYRQESECVGDIVKKISAELCQISPIDLGKLIGIKSRLEELHSKIDFRKDDVRIIGICGMGGIGKMTLAEVVYAQMSNYFEGKSFLANVRKVSKEHGLLSLQKKLLSHILLEEDFDIFTENIGKTIISNRLSHKKVLVVIDDADHIEHLQCLVGRRDWFGLGSRIIITTREEHLLLSHIVDDVSIGVDDVYKPTTLNAHEALRLFNLKAFNSDTVPENEFVELSKCVVKYADGLPLALKVLGCYLCGRDVVRWRSAIERLKQYSNKEIHDILKISFDGLEETDKNIFLDIACFFNGEEKDFVIKVLAGCKFSPDIGIDNLMKKSLLTINEDNKLKMHDLLQEMGREIERQKSINEPGNRCRLWKESDVDHVLTCNTATEAIEGIVVIDNEGEHTETFNCEYDCIEMTDVSYFLPPLGTDWFDERPYWIRRRRQTSTFSDALLKMKKLRLLKVLNPPQSSGVVEYLSNELRLLEWHNYPFKSLPSNFQSDNLVALLLPYSNVTQLWKANKALEKLKLVNLKGSQNLINTPNFKMTPNLESLILEDCTRIVDVHPSIGALRKLKLLNLRDCKSLKRFPEIDEEMECMLELHLDGTSIEQLPYSIGHLSNLVLLNLKDCTNLVCLPSSIDECKCLKTLNLSDCSKLKTLPENLMRVEFLEELDLSGTAIRNPPSFVFQFKNLKVLSFSGCKEPPSLLRPNFLSLFKPLLGRSTKSTALVLPPSSGLRSLTKLSLSRCNLKEDDIPSDIFCLSSLKELDLRGNNFMYLPDLTRLSRLCLIVLSDCKQLKSVPKLLTRIGYVSIANCTSLEVFTNPKPVCYSSIDCPYLNAINCYRLSKNGNALTMLKSFIKLFLSAPSFCILIPGSEIPKWFSFQSDESSIKIPLPPNIGNDSQWVGVAFCCVFGSTFTDGRIDGQDEMMSKAVIRDRTVDFSGFTFGKGYTRPPITKEHHWLRYWSRDKLYPFFLEDKCGETQNFLSINIKCNGCFEVKKCGVRIAYEKDLEEMEQMTEQCSTSAFASFDDHGGAFVNREFHNYDEEAAGSARDSFEETPQPKMLEKVINFIMGKKH